jgi:hypothetical protein
MIAGPAVTCNAMRRQRLGIAIAQVRTRATGGLAHTPALRAPASPCRAPSRRGSTLTRGGLRGRGSTLTRGGLGGGGPGVRYTSPFALAGAESAPRRPVPQRSSSTSPRRTTVASSYSA